jgi:hypothetical protein
MFHLDYLSCFLTILATVLVGRKSWTGLLISIVNSMIVCVIGFRTSQFGFIPANLICICVYAFSIRSWVKKPTRIGSGTAQVWGSGPRRRRWSTLPTLRSSVTPKLRGSRVTSVLRLRRWFQSITMTTSLIPGMSVPSCFGKHWSDNSQYDSRTHLHFFQNASTSFESRGISTYSIGIAVSQLV